MEMSNDSTSEFNDAVGYLRHINGLFRMASIHSMDMNAYSWFHTLNALYLVLSAEIKDHKPYDQKEENITNLLNLHRKILSQQIMPREIYLSLRDYEKSLRKVFKDSGLQNRVIDDMGRALR